MGLNKMKTKKINLKWAKSEEINNFNFGDDLGPYIINKLSGIKINYIRFANDRWNVIKEFVIGIINGKISIKYLNDFFRSLIIKEYIISIGSVLQWYGSARAVVWGSGIINRNNMIKESNFLAVRGEYTRKLINKLGYKTPLILGDPALLLPLVYSKKTKKKYRLGIIPHKCQFNFIRNKILHQDILIINLDSPDVEYVVDCINSCDYTISTSLHGIIVSHAYNIKSLWYKYDEIPIVGDDVKFYDYFSSVNIPEYDPFTLNFENRIKCEMIISTIIKNPEINQINVDLTNIQNQLIKVAPFPIKYEFRNMLE